MNTNHLRAIWKKANKKYRETNPNYKEAARRAEEKRKNDPKRLNYRQQYLASTKGRAYILRNAAKQRAKKHNLEFNLTSEWVLDRLNKGVCEVTQLPLSLVTQETYGERNNMHPFSPCIDRINPKFGYTTENSRVVCCIFNMCKFHWTDEDVMTFVKAFYERNM